MKIAAKQKEKRQKLGDKGDSGTWHSGTNETADRQTDRHVYIYTQTALLLGLSFPFSLASFAV